jgi:hypothetical protein
MKQSSVTNLLEERITFQKENVGKIRGKIREIITEKTERNNEKENWQLKQVQNRIRRRGEGE